MSCGPANPDERIRAWGAWLASASRHGPPAPHDSVHDQQQQMATAWPGRWSLGSPRFPGSPSRPGTAGGERRVGGAIRRPAAAAGMLLAAIGKTAMASSIRRPRHRSATRRHAVAARDTGPAAAGRPTLRRFEIAIRTLSIIHMIILLSIRSGSRPGAGGGAADCARRHGLATTHRPRIDHERSRIRCARCTAVCAGCAAPGCPGPGPVARAMQQRPNMHLHVPRRALLPRTPAPPAGPRARWPGMSGRPRGPRLPPSGAW